MVSITRFAYLNVREEGEIRTLDCTMHDKCRYSRDKKCCHGYPAKGYSQIIKGCKASNGRPFLFTAIQNAYKTRIDEHSVR